MFRSIAALLPILMLSSTLYACDSNKVQKESPESLVRSPASTEGGVPTAAAPSPDAPPAAAAQIKAALPFKDPIRPASYELPSGALATWREFAAYRPTLVLFSTHPLLDPIPQDRRESMSRLLRDGAAAEVVRRARLLCADPAVTPPETLSAAIEFGYFNDIVVVLPTKKGPDEVDLEAFRSRVRKAAFLTEAEARGLTLAEGTISGSVRGTHLRVAHPDRLPKIAGPVILHVDLGYFKDMYANEIKTPAYDLIHQLATSVRDAGYQALSVTLSFSNQEVGFALESRFLIRDLATLVRRPELLHGGAPESWTLRAKALYATAMFSQSDARELIFQATKVTPDDAAAHYSLAIELFEAGHSAEGFESLDRAVAFDRGYALEYLTLAERGLEMGKTDKAIDLLRKAAKALPENPFIRLQLANQLIRASRVQEARPIIAELQTLPWSDLIYPDIPPLLGKMKEAATFDAIVPLPDAVRTAPQKPVGRIPGFNHMGMGN